MVASRIKEIEQTVAQLEGRGVLGEACPADSTLHLLDGFTGFSTRSNI